MVDFTQAADAKQFRVAHASRVSGEHRLPACSCRQPCRQHPHAGNFEATWFSLVSASCRDVQAGSLRSPNADPPYLEIFPSALISFFSNAPTRCRAWVASPFQGEGEGEGWKRKWRDADGNPLTSILSPSRRGEAD